MRHALPHALTASKAQLMPVVTLTVMLLVLFSGVHAQEPGEFPHLVFRDDAGIAVPGPGEPFDNSGVLATVGGATIDVELSYQALAQPNELVFWGVLYSLQPAGTALDLIPPPPFVGPGLLLHAPGPPTLDATGLAAGQFDLPPGILVADVHVQALVLDTSAAPAIKLSNGIRLAFEVPQLNVSYAFALNHEDPQGEFGQLSTIDIEPALGAQLVPYGPLPAPRPSLGAADVDLGRLRFLPIVPNVGSDTYEPFARPVTHVTSPVTSSDSTIFVADTSGFPQRGELLLPLNPLAGTNDARNLFNEKSGGEERPPAVERVHYDGLTATSFLNCERRRVGSLGAVFGNSPHEVGDQVVGSFTMLTSAGAATRRRVCLDASNRDLPHVVIPPTTFVPPGGSTPITRDVDLYRYEVTPGNEPEGTPGESLEPETQGFLLLDRRRNAWQVIPGTARTPEQGRWGPVIAVAPDGRSFVAALRAPTGLFGWDNLADELWAVRLDDEIWPASGASTWRIDYALEPDPTASDNDVRGRRLRMQATFIAGPGPDDYVVYGALDHKWEMSLFGTGRAELTNGSEHWVSHEAAYLREATRHRDMFACPLTPPGSAKDTPSFPRPMLSNLPSTGFLHPVVRFDPGFRRSPDGARVLLVGGFTDREDDALLVRNIAVTQAGVPTHLLLNISLHRSFASSAGAFGPVNMRPFGAAHNGVGGKAAFSPGGGWVAWLAEAGPHADWIQIASTDGATAGRVSNVGQAANGAFREPGDLQHDRVVSQLHFVDEERLLFFMGRHPYDDPLATIEPGTTAAMDLFLYDRTTDELQNLTLTGSDAFGLGTIRPGPTFFSPDRRFFYFVRCGPLGPDAGDLAGTDVCNLVGLNLEQMTLFDVSGQEFGNGSLIPHLSLPPAEDGVPFANPVTLQLTEGAGDLAPMLYFAAHRLGAQGADDVFAVNLDAPFVSLPLAQAQHPGAHVSNITPSPISSMVAFARTDGGLPHDPRQHPFVVDLAGFLFERDVMPQFLAAGTFLGRVMDGSFHFVPASGNAPPGLVLGFGLSAVPPYGIAQTCAPTLYPLSTLTNLLAEPIPITIPLVDTIELSAAFRFYVPSAGLSQSL